MRRPQNLKKSPTCFDKTVVFTQYHQNKREIFSYFCGLFRKTELNERYFQTQKVHLHIIIELHNIAESLIEFCHIISDTANDAMNQNSMNTNPKN